MKKVIGYLRCSTDHQDTAHQKSSIESFAQSHDLTINEWYEEYISAYKTSIEDREQIQKVKSLAIEGKVSDLIIFEQSRLARNTREAVDIIDDLTKFNVRIWSVKDGKCINQHDIDKLLNLFQSYFSEQSSKDTSARIRSAKKLQKEKGEFLGGKISYGFKVEDDKLVIDEDARPIIKRAYELYLTTGASATIDYLKDYTDKYSNNATLLQWMEHPKMESIVGEELFISFIQTKASRSTHNNNTVRTNKSQELFEGLLFHSCDHKLTVDINRGNRRYICRSCKTNKVRDIKKSFSCARLTKSIEDEVIKILDELNKDSLQDKYNSENSATVGAIQARIKELNTSIDNKTKEQRKANENLQKLLLADLDINTIKIISDSINSMNEELEMLKANLESLNNSLKIEQVKISNREALVDQLLDFKYLYQEGTKEQQKAILRLLIDKIVVRDINDFSIHFNF